MKRYPMIEYMKRGSCDEIDTPIEALTPLLPHLFPHLPWKALWEPAPGRGVLAHHLSNCGYTVRVVPDLDYFTQEPTQWDIQVTNPPYSIKARWIVRACELSKPWALLVPITTLGIGKIQQYLDGCEIILLPRRIDFTGGGAPWFPVMWLTKGLNIGRGVIAPGGPMK